MVDARGLGGAGRVWLLGVLREVGRLGVVRRHGRGVVRLRLRVGLLLLVEEGRRRG